MAERFQRGGSGAILFRLRAADGRWRSFESSSNVVATEGGPRVVTVSRDVTERGELEAQLQQSQKREALGKLAGGIAHDFNNLLTIINGASEALLETAPEGSEEREDVEMILEAAERAAGLTWQLLAFGQRQQLDPRALHLGEVVSEMRDMLSRLIGEDIVLDVDIEAGLARVVADRGQMERVILNLAVNARDAMPEGGRLEIAARNVRRIPTEAFVTMGALEGPHVSLAVSDTGVGMDSATVTRIFDPFFTTKEIGRGTGLGLSTVYGIVEQAGGHLAVESAPGKGTKISMLLPQISLAAADEPEAAPRRESGGGETVLLVEDEPAARTLVRRQLERLGYRVTPAANAEEAIALAADPDIDLLVTDVVMPGLSGPELAQKLRATHPGLPVMFISGNPGQDVSSSLLDPERNLLRKPFRSEALARMIREILSA
jgi:signal transduction histidine kinase/CheY-like chemotaxis protein